LHIVVTEYQHEFLIKIWIFTFKFNWLLYQTYWLLFWCYLMNIFF